MTSGFVIVTAAGRDQGPLVECLRRMDGARPIVVATTPEGAQLEERPALILIDLEALGDEGITAVRAFRVRWPEAPLVAVGSAHDEPAIDTALRAGASAFVPHSYSDTQKLLVLRLALEGVGHRPHSVGAGANGGESHGAAVTAGESGSP
ncbi:MAG TPA: hypothetical protein VFU53_07670, partial [Burkholderiales bacterium]|nr:hypothetical protein [Burkholderiales bacterium]